MNIKKMPDKLKKLLIIDSVFYFLLTFGFITFLYVTNYFGIKFYYAAALFVGLFIVFFLIKSIKHHKKTIIEEK